MSFVEPLFLAGILAAALPVIIHLINRRKATRVMFPAMRLLLESNRREASSIKVRKWLLLLLRVLVVALLAIALAKPFMLSDRGVTASERLPTAVVVVVDDTASMRHGDWWAEAADAFDDRIDRLRPWDEVALITVSDPDGPQPRLTTDHGEVRQAFESLEPTYQSASLPEALLAAGDVLAASQLPGQKVVVVSDFARGGFPAAAAAESAIPYPVERVVVREQAHPANLAITHVDYAQEGSGRDAMWRITASVANRGEADADDVEVRLNIDAEEVGGGLIDVDTGKTVDYVFRHRLQGSGVRQAVVELVDADDFTADNRYHVTIQMRDRIRALLVNGEPSSSPRTDELFFMSRALNPGSQSESAIVPTMTTVDGMSARPLDKFDVVVLANATAIPPADAKRLEAFVEGGGGLLITAGDQMDPDAWNQQMGELLPKPLRGMKRLAERDDPDAPVKITRLGAGNHDHPVFRTFEAPGGQTLQSVEVYSYMLLEPTPPKQSTVVLSYKDDAPALIERKVGKGRTMLLTTTVDREWTSLPVRAVFLPLMRRSVEVLARRVTSTGREPRTAGERVELEVGALVDERAIVRGPDGLRLVLEPVDGRVNFRPGLPGFYTVWADSDEAADAGLADAAEGADAEAPDARLDALAFAVNADRDESQLARLPDDALSPWIATERDAEAGEAPAAATHERRVNLWSPLLFVITLFLLLETMLGTRRSVLARLWRKLTLRGEERVEV